MPRLRKIIFPFFVCLALIASDVLARDAYHVVPKSSAVRFKIKHMGIGLVNGRFQEFSGTIIWEGDRLTGFEGEVDMPSLATGNPTRDRDLKSEKFFAVEKFPKMIIKSKEITQTDGKITIQSELTIRDITKTIELRGTVSSPKDNMVTLHLEGIINRAQYNLWLRHFLEIFVSNKVYISLDLQAES